MNFVALNLVIYFVKIIWTHDSLPSFFWSFQLRIFTTQRIMSMRCGWKLCFVKLLFPESRANLHYHQMTNYLFVILCIAIQYIFWKSSDLIWLSDLGSQLKKIACTDAKIISKSTIQQTHSLICAIAHSTKHTEIVKWWLPLSVADSWNVYMVLWYIQYVVISPKANCGVHPTNSEFEIVLFISGYQVTTKT